MEPPREHIGSTENQSGTRSPSHHNSDVSDDEPTRWEERNTTEEPEIELEEVEQDTLQREDTTERDQTVPEEEQKDASDRRDKATQEEHSAPQSPRIVVTTERNIEKHKRKRVSSVLKNDIDQYLVGYGEDYGALSSVTDLDQEGLKRFGRRDIAKRLDKVGAKRSGDNQVHKLKTRVKTEHESKATVPKAKTDSPPQKSKKLPRFPKFSKGPKFVKKQGFSASDVLHRGEERIQMTAHILPEPGQLSMTQEETHPAEDRNLRNETNLKINHMEDPAESRPRAQSADSIAVNTSVGSSCSDSETPLDVEEGADTVLPQETETVAEQVMRLHSSIETYGPEITAKVRYISTIKEVQAILWLDTQNPHECCGNTCICTSM